MKGSLLPNVKGDAEVTADRSGIKRLSAGYENINRKKCGDGERETVLWTKRLNMLFAIGEQIT